MKLLLIFLLPTAHHLLLSGSPPVELLLREWKLYWNEERTRCFCALLVWPTAADGSSAAATESDTATVAAAFSSSSAAGGAPCRSPCCTPLSASRARASHALLLSLIARVDKVMAAFGLPAYYSPPELHATVSWKLPPPPPPQGAGTAQLLQDATPSADADASTAVELTNNDHAEVLSASSPSSLPSCCVCECDRVQLSVGNRLYTLPFQPAAASDNP